MALLPYDSTKHHVGLGPSGGTSYGLTIDGGYSKQGQREARAAADYGGAQDDLVVATPGVSRWSQDEFIGGAYQYRVLEDKARFANSKNLIPQLQGVGAISIPPMIAIKEFDPLDAAYLTHLAVGVSDPTYVQPKAMFPIAGSVYLVFKHGIFRWRSDTGALTFGGEASFGSYLNIVDGAYDQNDQCIYLLCSPNQITEDDNLPFLYRLNTDLSLKSVQQQYTAPAGLENGHAKGMCLNAPGGNILVGVGLRAYVVKPPKRTNLAGQDPTWTEVGRLPGTWVASCSYNARAYVLCNEADGETHIVSYDGTQIVPVTSFPFNFEGRAMEVYGGRLFVAGIGTDVNGGDRYGEIYEVTGASVRLVRTFIPEHNADYGSAPKIFHDLAVDDGLLWTSHQGTGLVAYDLTADGFWGGPEYQIDGGVPSNFEIFKFCRGRASLYGYGQRNGLNENTGLYRVAINTDTVTAYDCELETSDFDHQIARKKRWSELVVQVKNQTGMVCYYSQDSGGSWTAIDGIAQETVNDVTTFTVPLQAIPVSNRIRFKMVFNQGTDVSLDVMELIAFTCSFIFLDTGKFAWNLSVLGAETIEDFAGDTLDQDESDLAAKLTEWWEEKTSLTFTDLDGSTHNVSLVDFQETRPVIGPNKAEAFFRVVLQEV